MVRVLNLWRSHGVFDEAQVKPWLDYCREQHNLGKSCLYLISSACLTFADEIWGGGVFTEVCVSTLWQRFSTFSDILRAIF